MTKANPPVSEDWEKEFDKLTWLALTTEDTVLAKTFIRYILATREADIRRQLAGEMEKLKNDMAIRIVGNSSRSCSCYEVSGDNDYCPVHNL